MVVVSVIKQQTLTHALKGWGWGGGVMLQESEGFEGGNMINLLHVQYVNIADHLCKTFSFQSIQRFKTVK